MHFVGSSYILKNSFEPFSAATEAQEPIFSAATEAQEPFSAATEAQEPLFSAATEAQEPFFVATEAQQPFFVATEAQGAQKPTTTLCLHPRQSTASEPILL